MPPQPTAVPVEAVDLYTGYLDWLAARGVGNKTFYGGARSFLARFPDPQAWARLRWNSATATPLHGFSHSSTS